MTAPTNLRMGAAEWAMLILLSVLWGGSFFFLGVALREVPPFTLVLARLGLSSLLMLGFMAATRRAMPRRAGLWPALFLLALLNTALPFSLFAYAQTQIASGLASILNATTPLWGVIVAHLFTLDEKATPAKLTGVCAGLAGVAVMIGGAALSGSAPTCPRSWRASAQRCATRSPASMAAVSVRGASARSTSRPGS